ncbi:hypothetical protein ACVWZ8_004973 [Arthrobacter sp. UYCu723]
MDVAVAVTVTDRRASTERRLDEAMARTWAMQ